jgi:hypothetical protein
VSRGARSWSVRNDELTTIGELSVDINGCVVLEVIGTEGKLSEKDSIELARAVLRKSLQDGWVAVRKENYEDAMRLLEEASDGGED